MITEKKAYPLEEGKINFLVLAVSTVILVFFAVMAHQVEVQTFIAPPVTNGLGPIVISTTTEEGYSATTTVVVATTTATTSTPVKPKPSTPATVPIPSPLLDVGHAVGIAGGGELSKISSSGLKRQLDQMVDLGITWIRFDIEWGLVQYSTPTKSNWASYDTLVKAANAHKLNSLAILLFTPEWARDSACRGGAKCPPKNPAQFATFAVEAVNRYKNMGVHHWEIWNEPNNYAFWATKADCVAYTQLLKATYPAIKKADPKAVVVLGGLSPGVTDNNNISPLDFLECVYKNGGKNYFDAVGDHPYTFPELPSGHRDNTWGQMSTAPRNLRSIMVAYGDSNKKIWITEYGAPTNGPDSRRFVSEDRQGQIVTDALRLYKGYDWVGPLFWYSLKDNGTATTSSENFFGLTYADSTEKPAYFTMKSVISAGL
ncbi:MAG: cellulase family glycosylhydrolase [Patescibacteria group bacterium]